MLIQLFIKCVFSISDVTKKALRHEDLRMARHLISQGIRVTHPEYPFLKLESIEKNINHPNNPKLHKEDSRMIRHLSMEGFTVN
ncbi:hypothetical protein G9O61_00g020670 [Vairimorpha ceranae]|nr:hypothetical protein G9O61_00g020670 [Vairimorpha ceranae]